MARKTKKKSGFERLSSGLAGMGSFAVGSGRTVVLSILVIGALVIATMLTWNSVSERVLSSSDYILTAEDFEITPLPPWIRTKIANQAFVYLTASGGQLSIMDDNVTELVAQAFSEHPWVERVVRVSKHHPARIVVELEYRRPVCMVMVRDSNGDNGLYPVDARGIFLPTADFTPVEASRYPCLNLVGIDVVPVGGVGKHWGDERVVGAAEIAEAFGDDWYKLDLKLIEPDKASRSAYHSVYAYVIYTNGGTKILWGRPPGSELPSEAPAADKIARLKEFAEVRGSLDGSQPRTPLDVRNREGLRVLERMAMKIRSERLAEKVKTDSKSDKSKRNPALKRTAAKQASPRS
ncbi:MAG: hypothetical protein JXM70_11230 [Pirellulales bacterium]|nr:hypothetical protein [Pirellulales bacterium]